MWANCAGLSYTGVWRVQFGWQRAGLHMDGVMPMLSPGGDSKQVATMLATMSGIAEAT